jgi:hypothetical protein
MNNNNNSPFLTVENRNSNYTMYRIGSGDHYIIVNRTNDIVASGKRKHVIEVWNNAGTATRAPMWLSA